MIPTEPARVMPGRKLSSLTCAVQHPGPQNKTMNIFNASCFAATMLAGICAHAQHTFSGKITDSEGNPLPGATIALTETYTGTSSGQDGTYRIRGLGDGKYPLSIRFIGYHTITDTIEIDGTDVEKNYALSRNAILKEEVIISATRASESTPVTFQNIDKEELENRNLGQDLPYMLRFTPSLVTTSDAGAGVGYTGMRIRGSDATRINVTVNGIPVNDAESHGVFWVNMPDFTSSIDNLQIQRGVGTSTNGAAAFGASVNLQTAGLDTVPYAEINNSYGSFNTHRHNLMLGSGLLNDHFSFEGRLSYIGSDGYIDRSASELSSYYLSGGYYSKKVLVKGITFGGRETTQQAWYGTPESRITGNTADMLAHAELNGYSPEQTTNLLESGRTYNYYTYDNEIDHYQQDHYQLHTSFQVTEQFNIALSGHYTKGRGYFEQFREKDDFSDYGLAPPVIGADTIFSSDIIRRRWLDNDFYGGIYSFNYNTKRWDITLGGGYNEYDGDHFGEIIWAEYAAGTDIGERYYFSNAFKQDLNNFIKANFKIGRGITLYGDVQTRYIAYTSQGIDSDQRPIDINEHYFFLNPKGGANWQFSGKDNAYLSYSRSSREPVRSDFTDASPGVVPKPEFLDNVELGYQHSARKWMIGANYYMMYYKDQLVLTGEVNDVGSPVRTNVPESYRTGIEFIGGLKISEAVSWDANLTLSQNKITSFNETVIDYTNGYDLVSIPHENTDIAFSPNIIAGSRFMAKTKFGVEAALLSKYVGRQFLDNTSNEARSIPAYFVNDIRISYSLESKYWKNLEVTILVNNIMDVAYESNGYTYSYIYVDTITENFYYPQAGRNYLVGLKLRF